MPKLVVQSAVSSDSTLESIDDGEDGDSGIGSTGGQVDGR